MTTSLRRRQRDRARASFLAFAPFPFGAKTTTPPPPSHRHHRVAASTLPRADAMLRFLATVALASDLRDPGGLSRRDVEPEIASAAASLLRLKRWTEHRRRSPATAERVDADGGAPAPRSAATRRAIGPETIVDGSRRLSGFVVLRLRAAERAAADPTFDLAAFLGSIENL